jgi:hypothetical protein
MKVEFRCIHVPVNWRVLAHMIEHDTLLRDDVKLVVWERHIAFFDPSGGQYVVTPPPEFRGEDFTEAVAMQLLKWLVKTFRAAFPGTESKIVASNPPSAAYSTPPLPDPVPRAGVPAEL